MKKPFTRKLSLSTETVRDLRAVDDADLKHAAGGDSDTGSCQADGCASGKCIGTAIQHRG
jgi:hypothetical protein